MKKPSIILRTARVLLLATSLATFLIALAGCTSSPKPPHVVVVVIDTLRADRLSCYGYDRTTSPEIDALASRGVRFEHAYSQSSWTRPSMASMLTSLYPRSVGIHHERSGILNDEFTTLAEVLDGHGYRTLGATANPHLNRSFNFHQGFDHYIDSTAVWPWMESGGTRPAAGPRLASARQLMQELLDTLDRESTEERRAPHYLQLTLMEVHETSDELDLVRQEFEDDFADVEFAKARRYLQAIRQVSHDLDWWVRTLEARPGWEDTVFVITSDHGEGLDSHPDVPESASHGKLLYESHVRVPWILFATTDRLPAGRVVGRPVRLLELMPTVLDLAGVPFDGRVRGRSLMPLLIDGIDPGLPDTFIVETRYQPADKIGAITADWKFFHNRDGHRGVRPLELQPGGSDENGERTDVGASHPSVLRQLHATVQAWERENPATPSTTLEAPLSPDALEQLRSLGYID